jgi:HEAT repeat protein
MSWFIAPNVQALLDNGDVMGLVGALRFQKKKSDIEAKHSRSNAAKALWQLGQKSMDPGQSKIATKALCKAMGDIDPAVRLPACGALGAVSAHMGKCPTRIKAMQALLAGLSDKRSDDIRTLAAQGLGQVVIGWAHKPLSEGMKYHIQNMIDDAASTLAEISRIILPFLENASGDPSCEVRAAAVLSLGMLSGSKSMGALIQASGDSAASVRAAALQGLSYINDARATERMAIMLRDKAQSMRTAAADALDLRSWRPRTSESSAAYAIARLRIAPGQLDATTIAMLLADLLEEDASIASQSAKRLSAGDASIAQSLADSLPGAAPPARDRTLDTLAAIGIPALEPLIKALEAQDSELRRAAVKALRKIGDKRAIEPLVSLLGRQGSSASNTGSKKQTGEDPESTAIVGALGSLGWTPDRTVAGAIFCALRKDWAGCERIGKSAVAPLLEQLGKGDSIAILDTLSRIGDARAVEPLIRLLSDLEFKTREAAALALVNIYSRDTELPEDLKKHILKQREKITQPHHSLSKTEHTDYTPDARCMFTHNDTHGRIVDHEDRGIGVNFPA